MATTTTTPASTTPAAPPVAPFVGGELSPCNWNITPEGTGIVAQNNDTGRIYSGSMEDFNSLLRGA